MHYTPYMLRIENYSDIVRYSDIFNQLEIETYWEFRPLWRQPWKLVGNFWTAMRKTKYASRKFEPYTLDPSI